MIILCKSVPFRKQVLESNNIGLLIRPIVDFVYFMLCSPFEQLECYMQHAANFAVFYRLKSCWLSF